MRSPRSTNISCNITVISPTHRWNLDVSGLHLSIKIVNKGQSSLTYLNCKWMNNHACLTYSMIQLSVESTADMTMSDPISQWPKDSAVLHINNNCSTSKKKCTILIFKLTFIQTYPAWVNLSGLCILLVQNIRTDWSKVHRCLTCTYFQIFNHNYNQIYLSLR